MLKWGEEAFTGQRKGKASFRPWEALAPGSRFFNHLASDAHGSCAGKASLEPILLPKQADVPSGPLPWGEWAQDAVTVGGQGLRGPEAFCSVWLEEPTRMGRAEVLDAVSPTALPLR